MPNVWDAATHYGATTTANAWNTWTSNSSTTNVNIIWNSWVTYTPVPPAN